MTAAPAPTIDAVETIGPRAAGRNAQGARTRHGSFAADQSEAPTAWGRGRTAERTTFTPSPAAYARSLA